MREFKNILEQLFFRGLHLCYISSLFSPIPHPHCHSLKSDKLWHETKEDSIVYIAVQTSHYIKIVTYENRSKKSKITVLTNVRTHLYK